MHGIKYILINVAFSKLHIVSKSLFRGTESLSAIVLWIIIILKISMTKIVGEKSKISTFFSKAIIFSAFPRLLSKSSVLPNDPGMWQILPLYYSRFGNSVTFSEYNVTIAIRNAISFTYLWDAKISRIVNRRNAISDKITPQNIPIGVIFFFLSQEVQINQNADHTFFIYLRRD